MIREDQGKGLGEGLINIAGDIITAIGGQSGTLAQSALSSTDPCATRAGRPPTQSRDGRAPSVERQ